MNVQETMPRTARLFVVPTYDELSRRAVQTIVQAVHLRPNAVISLTTGHTMAGAYRLLGEMCRAGAIDLAATQIVSSEEYAGVGAEDPISLFGWLRRDMLDPCGISPASVLRLKGDAPDLAQECQRFDAEIERLGGIDLVVQSVGPNGHFGFNEPGSARDAPSRVVALAASTRQSNTYYWHDGAHVPEQGLTMGVRETLRARHVLLLASSDLKMEALASALDGPITERVPCSLLRLTPRLTIVADQDAAGSLHTGDI